MRLIFFGPPGSGKGTQADMLKAEFNLEKLSTGDLLRNEIKINTKLGKHAAQYLDSGELVPDDIMIEIIEHKTMEFKEKDTGFILDGFPRTIAQAEGLKSMLKRHHRPLDAVFHIDVPKEILIKRLCSRWTCRHCHAIYSFPEGLPKAEVCSACGGELYQRDDDKKATIMNRIKIYEDKTMPLIKFYKNENLYIKINGFGNIEEITQKIRAILTEKLEI
ncbi:MAG: adenylate kinase [Candidatus Marinimicrobia bacterium]|nr:adenylate kinase [Candidatus Neomarinimicrobiota bacterium]